MRCKNATVEIDNMQPKSNPSVQNEMDQNSFSSSAFSLNGLDIFLILVLVFLSAFSRFWIIQFPRNAVYDEGKQIHIINSYLNGSIFVDTQPPLGSLILSAAARHSHYDQSYVSAISEKNYTFQNMKYVSLRFPSAFAAMIVVPLSFFIVRCFGGSKLAAMSSGLFTLMDFLLIALGRSCFTDGLLQLFVAASVLSLAVSEHFTTESISEKVFLILQSFFVGCAVSTNINAFGLWVFFIFWNRKSLIKIMYNIFIPVAMLFISFCLQVYYMPFHSLYESCLPESYIRNLYEPSSKYVVDYFKIPLRAFQLMMTMFKLRFLINENGKWYLWPLMMCKYTVLWTHLGRYVACFGNVATWWPMCLSIIYMFLKGIITRSFKTIQQKLCIGYLLSLVCFSFICNNREICDYQIPLMFGLWILPLIIDKELSPEMSGFILPLIIVSGFVIFYLWAPLVYGYENFDTRFLPYFAK